MSPIPAAVAAPTIKAAGQITSAIIGRYRPAGVPRTGSSEDRAAAYQRLLDAATHAHSFICLFRHMQRTTSGKAAENFLTTEMPRVWDSGSELICALGGVRLRGTIPVIATAEKLVNAVTELDMNDRNEAQFTQHYKAVVSAQNGFLDAARTDLGYDTRPWQVLRRRRERRFLRQQAAAAIEG
jgi:hypothetical protein